jgi:hypothetical protein
MNKIFIKADTELIGVNNIVLSEVDNKIYISTSAIIQDSIEGSLAIYFSDDSKQIVGTGPKCVWNKDLLILELENVSAETIQSKILKSSKIDADYIKVEISESEHFKSNSINTESIESDYATSKKIAVKNWLGFDSKIKQNSHPFKLLVHQIGDKETLLLIANEYKEDTVPKVLMSFEDERVRFLTRPNIVSRTIQSSVGEKDDIKGDIAVDENFIYYCIQNFDGMSKIWKRSPMSHW